MMDRRQLGELLSLVNPIGATAVVVGRMVEDFEVRTIIHNKMTCNRHIMVNKRVPVVLELRRNAGHPLARRRGRGAYNPYIKSSGTSGEFEN